MLLALDSTSEPAQPGEGVFHDGTAVGSNTSAAWGYRTGLNLAMAYIDPEHAAEGVRLGLWLLGVPVKATVCAPCLHDPDNLIPRGLS